MRCFVTGADGFIGSHLVEELVARGHAVTALAQYNSLNSAGWLDSISEDTRRQITVISGDIRDSSFMREAIKNHERVAHLAALIAIPYSYAAPASYVDVNILGTLNVLEACRLAGTQRVLHTSTSEVYGSAQYVPIDEGHPILGQSPYSASKIGADQLAYSFWASYGLPVVTVRPFNTYGPRQSQRAFIPAVAVQLLSNEKSVALGSLAPTRDLTFVRDTARGLAIVLESDQGLGETFNMGTGFEISIGEVVKLLFEIAGRQLEIHVDPQRVRPENSEVERLWSDSSKARDTFGWEPEKPGGAGLREGLAETYRWLADPTNLAKYQPTRYVV